MTDAYSPEPEPGNALVPPPRNPPTAIATSAPLPPRRPSPTVRPDLLRGLVNSALDALDRVGDTIATAIGVR